MTIGTEHEFSINDSRFTAQPVSDEILREICGRYESEILFGEVKLGKELQKTVLEMIPRHPVDELSALGLQPTILRDHALAESVRGFGWTLSGGAP